MADSIPRCMSAALINRLHALAERRCEHLIDMKRSGRWALYYSREAMVEQMRDAAKIAKQWQDMSETVRVPDPATPPAAAPPEEVTVSVVKAA